MRDIIILRDYKNSQIHFIQVGFEYDSNNAIEYKYTCVKAPNGNIYLVYIRWTSNSNKQLVVYNLTKDSVLYKLVYNSLSDVESKIENDDIEKYVYFLGNLVVLIYKAVEDGFYICIVDLVSETISKFNFTIKDYLSSLSSLVDSKTDRKAIKSLYSPKQNPALYATNNPIWELTKVERIMAKSEGDVLYIRQLKLHYTISSKIVLNQTNSTIIVSFTYKDDELEIKVTTGTPVLIETDTQPSVKIQVPTNVILLTKSHKLRDSYDI